MVATTTMIRDNIKEEKEVTLEAVEVEEEATEVDTTVEMATMDFRTSLSRTP